MNSPSTSIQKIFIDSPAGSVEVEISDEMVISVGFTNDRKFLKKDKVQPTPLSKEAKRQFEAYFSGKSFSFDLPLSIQGTPFQKRVWEQLLEIPYGKTISYAQLANRLGDPKCIRAAASANGKNPFAIIIPCHRVIGSDGSLTGYAGGIEKKRWLLEHESLFANGLQLLF